MARGQQLIAKVAEERQTVSGQHFLILLKLRQLKIWKQPLHFYFKRPTIIRGKLVLEEKSSYLLHEVTVNFQKLVKSLCALVQRFGDQSSSGLFVLNHQGPSAVD